MKYGNGNPISIHVTKVNSKARLIISDQGIGIAPEDQIRIFDRFERAASPMNYSGLGLGLFIVREIVNLHGGKLLVESQLGQGSKFTIELPTEA